MEENTLYLRSIPTVPCGFTYQRNCRSWRVWIELIIFISHRFDCHGSLWRFVQLEHIPGTLSAALECCEIGERAKYLTSSLELSPDPGIIQFTFNSPPEYSRRRRMDPGTDQAIQRRAIGHASQDQGFRWEIALLQWKGLQRRTNDPRTGWRERYGLYAWLLMTWHDQIRLVILFGILHGSAHQRLQFQLRAYNFSMMNESQRMLIMNLILLHR